MASATNVISVTCECGKRLKAPAAAAGKRARCPACGNVHVLPQAGLVQDARRAAARTAMAPAGRPPIDPFESGGSEMPPEETDPFAALSAMAEQENIAPVASSAVHCPQCQSAMADGAVLCVNCGYNTRTGKAIAAASAPPAAAKPVRPAAGKKKGKVDYMAPTGSLALGVVCSAAFALAASLVWIGVAWATGLAIGYIAILIGIAAGVGMQVGHKGQSQIGGLIAGGMTLAAIVVAKVAVLYLIMDKLGFHGLIWDLNSAALGMYFFSPIGLIIIVIGIGAGYRTASGAIRE